ncbi:hypothetical protein [Granulicella sp. L60]|jgi:hypothetical protein|uniref:hypothetical protein n=1 Tax=Granulicella sp. L60 TaxID=1641866 RepID=UPI00131E8AF6|nr:hypothetical protein [Granulicella sp. L60]
MIDIDLFVQALRNHGHTVERVFSVPENAGGYELTVDGTNMNIEEARRLLDRQEEQDEAK